MSKHDSWSNSSKSPLRAHRHEEMGNPPSSSTATIKVETLLRRILKQPKFQVGKLSDHAKPDS